MTVAANLLARLVDLFDFNQYSNRNLVVDPAKENWSTSSAQAITSIPAYGPNVMYLNSCGSGGVGTYGFFAFSPAAGSRLGLPKIARYFGQHIQSTASTGTVAALTSPQLSVKVEDVNTTEGSSITLSMWLWATAPMTITQVRATQNFGTGGSPSAAVEIPVAVNWPVTATLRRFSVRIDLPSVSGKTLGTTTPHFTRFTLDLPPGTTFTLNDACWQLEICSPQASSDNTGNGGAPTAFEYRGAAAELARVQRYYEVNSMLGVFSGNVTSGGTYFSNAYFKVTKRATPTVTAAQSGSPTSFPTTVALAGAYNDGVFVSALANATNLGIYQYSWVADARL
jgi:hypothetical protein